MKTNPKFQEREAKQALKKLRPFRTSPPRLEGLVTKARDGSMCTYCPNTPAPYLAELNVGVLTLCAACLESARKVGNKRPGAAMDREKQEAMSRADDYKKERVTVSGGGANGTGSVRR